MTAQEARKLLGEQGFINVTGLTARSPYTGEQYQLGEKLPSTERGRFGEQTFGEQAGRVVIITNDGEIWLGAGKITPHREVLIRKLCPRGNGAWVPCSNGDHLFADELLERASNPDWTPQY